MSNNTFVCVCKYPSIIYTYIHTYIDIYIYTYMCIYVFMHVYIHKCLHFYINKLKGKITKGVE